MLKKYFKYIKDNPHNYWFKAKLYGYGWTPVKWRGWLVLSIFLLFILWNASTLPISESVNEDAVLVWFLVKTFSAVLILVWICYLKGEKPRWRWGLPK